MQSGFFYTSFFFSGECEESQKATVTYLTTIFLNHSEYIKNILSVYYIIVISDINHRMYLYLI